MAGTATRSTAAPLVFRSRAVWVAGIIDVVVGTAVVLAGLGIASMGEVHGVHGVRKTLPLGLAICIVGLVPLMSGLSRINARIEITPTHVMWTWSFSRQALALEDLDDAALVEKGAPASGAAWAGFLGGGFGGVLAWWLFDVACAFFNTEPSLGSVELVVIKHYGGPVSVKPIGAWSTRPSHSQANEALHYLKAAIAASPRHRPKAATVLRVDAWDDQRER